MQTMTSAYANKMLKSLEEAFWLNKEEEACTYVAAINEEPVVPDYDYVEVATTIAALDEKIAIIKHTHLKLEDVQKELERLEKAESEL